MDAKQEYITLKRRWMESRGDEREQVQKQLDAFLDTLDEDGRKQVIEAVSLDFDDIHARIEEAKELKLRAQMEQILPFISVSHLARCYFGKSASWFYQRLNGNIVHGKPCRFTPEELKQVKFALNDIKDKLSDTIQNINFPA